MRHNGFSGYCGGFEYIKAAVPYAIICNDALTLVRAAALGGSRHETKSVSTQYSGVHTIKKARPRLRNCPVCPPTMQGNP